MKATQGKTSTKAMTVQPNANETLMTMEATMLHTFESAQIKDSNVGCDVANQ